MAVTSVSFFEKSLRATLVPPTGIKPTATPKAARNNKVKTILLRLAGDRRKAGPALAVVS